MNQNVIYIIKNYPPISKIYENIYSLTNKIMNGRVFNLNKLIILKFKKYNV